jgi:hypothetical protein
MTTFTKYLILSVFFMSSGHLVTAQPIFASSSSTNNLPCKPPKNRELFHDYIDAQQKNVLRSDGKNDNQFTPSTDDEINFLVTRSLVKNIDDLQCKIEMDSSLKDQVKVKYLRGIESLLKFFIANTANRKVSPLILPDIITAYESCVENDKKGLSIEAIINGLSYEAGYTLVKAENLTFEKNPGYKAAQQSIVLKYCKLHPDQIFPTLQQNPDVSFADSLIREIAQKYPRQLYDYAAANNKLGYIIRNITDDIFIKSVVKMAKSKSGQQYFPFLDNIVKGKMTFAQIDSVKSDSLQYYRLLVKTQMDYVRRATINKDTAMEFKALTEKLETRAKESFVNVINGLHTEPAEIRFNSIQSLTAEELYYLAVMADGTIYTSSFVKGVYPLMMQKINNRGDSLLQLVYFDRYRKLIKMAAGYNTLGHFLSTFPHSSNPAEESPANTLMRAFVKNLEKGDGPEDAVDVADSYASIAETLKPIADDMLINVKDNYSRNEAAGNKKGVAIYRILNKLFLSADTSNHIDLTTELGIPPVYEVPYKSLLNDSGRVIMQVFFYGDKDGQGIFKGFLGTFANSNWKITETDEWVCINSVKGKPVSIYANKPLPEEGGQDEQAQKELISYLGKNNLNPVVTIHRGHSYTAPSTVEQMAATSKIVFLGSCGGYLIIHDVLEVAPDAHIIATKQIGDTRVNRPFFQLLSEKLRTGNNIDWIPFWKELKQMAQSEDFEDYIPPYKNLGALFIKAYKIAMGE